MELNSLLILHGIVVILGALLLSLFISITIFYVPRAIIIVINNIKGKKKRRDNHDNA